MSRTITDLGDVVSLAVYCKVDFTLMLTVENNEHWIPSTRVPIGHSWEKTVSKDLIDVSSLLLDNNKFCFFSFQTPILLSYLCIPCPKWPIFNFRCSKSTTQTRWPGSGKSGYPGRQSRFIIAFSKILWTWTKKIKPKTLWERYEFSIF